MKSTAASCYPPLMRVPNDEQDTWVAHAEAAIPLRPEQLTALGYCPHLTGVVLLPKNATSASPAQIDALFPPTNRHFLSDILELALEVRS